MLACGLIQAKFVEIGAMSPAEGPEGFAAFIRAELPKWREMARRGDISLD